MRALALAILLLLPVAYAGTTSTADPEHDGRGSIGGQAASCDDAATDLVAFSAHRDGPILAARASLRNYSTTFLFGGTCEGSSQSWTQRSWYVNFNTTDGEIALLAVHREELTGASTTSCVVNVGAGRWGACRVGFARDGDDLIWTVPTSDVVSSDDGLLRSYDLAAQPLDVRAVAWASFDCVVVCFTQTLVFDQVVAPRLVD